MEIGERDIVEEDIKKVLSENLPWNRLRNKTIAVSGSRGFIASWIVKLLESIQEEYNITIWHINKPEYDINRSLFSIGVPKRVDYIFHAASYASPLKFKENPVDVILPNTIGTHNLLKLADAKEAEFVYFSTSGVYGWHDFDDYPLSEKQFGRLDCSEVKNCYLESKRLGEQLCVSHSYQYDIEIKILRLGICYGPGLSLDDGRVMNTFIKKILDKKELPVYNEHVYRSFMYITDVLSAIFTILFHGENSPYNVSADKEISILQLAQLFSSMYPNSKLSYLKRTDRLSVDFNRTWMNTGKLKNLGWEQRVSLEDGIERTVESY
ncbi:MAG: NAD-dependent epimerase/dehydratase family protein [PVC group bacterium]|nr:NAD-dependent epimerase/dehydratase family protein [PVC group bacterium]